jgi:L-lactate dehydrogenase
MQQKLNTSIAIIGAGDVGASIAYALLLNPVAHDVILVDLKDELVEAQVRDLGDATFRGNSGVRVKKGDYKEAGQADVVVVTAGAKQKEGEWC